MRLSIVIGVLNQFELSTRVIEFLCDNLSYGKDVQMIVIDNGSDTPFLEHINSTVTIKRLSETLGEFTVIRNDTNVGNYPLFFQGINYCKAPVAAFLHSDLFVYQKDWDAAVTAVFDANPNLGLVGFIGSTELDSFGGRGLGTVSNFQGATVDKWTGSVSTIHGRKDEGFIIDGAVVDGCAMIFRKDTFLALEHKENFPPHHFYDRLMSAQVRAMGQKVAILGIKCDHISGQTANQEGKWHDTAREWCEKNLGITEPQQWVEKNRTWWSNTMNPSRGHTPSGWDHAVYLEAERLFLTEYRDEKKIVPIFMQ